MASDENVHFQFNFRGVEVELAGERSFVEAMYQEVMRDIEAARRAVGERDETIELPDEEALVWVHRCSEMMRKIYMATCDDLEATILSEVLKPEALGTMYVDKHVFDRILPNIALERTMWAELTEEGRRKLSGASEQQQSEQG